MTLDIKNYTIYGERCSGTNYLEQLMTANFNIPITWEYGYKHFFGHAILDPDTTKHTLFIGIVRHPIQWLNSFFKEQHHVPRRPKPLFNFLLDTWYSIDNNNAVIAGDLRIPIVELCGHTMPGNRASASASPMYKNIFEMRFYKNYYLLNTLPTKVAHTILINYEMLRDNSSAMLQMISEKFNITPKFPLYKQISHYKDVQDKTFVKRPLELPLNVIALCWKYLHTPPRASFRVLSY